MGCIEILIHTTFVDCFLVVVVFVFFKANSMTTAKSVLRKSFFSIDHCAVLFVSLLFIQQYTAIYYVAADLIMLSMYTYYKLKNKASQGELFLGGGLLAVFNRRTYTSPRML